MSPCLRQEVVPAEPELVPVGRQPYRDAMARLGAAVNVVTTDGPGGRHGFTASAVCSVTDDPPTLLVCLNRGSSASAIVHANRVLCVNTLAAGQQELSDRFGGRVPPAERFEAGKWQPGVTGAPVLLGALASFDCRIARFVEVGTHDVLFCEVVGLGDEGAREGLMYFLRGYHALRGASSD
ncbi:flavin reductase [Ancylobacter defluvii]|uniref:FMN reductase (NADH) RutF n=1 Tax=Ancylobacter defluvii TaxID=1282440 RepID=A0A9W6K0K3_9HYPH|nr:flavin reductase [Ancylobacter defluvii]MBS7589116.1 flavin reductase [Ancylobacter defluvii]GLK84728.1 FMN reductase (NADH) RutF [Ancylobacter defluvii]